MKFIDLFAGLGGFHLALTALGHECVFASEIDDELRDIYSINFPRFQLMTSSAPAFRVSRFLNQALNSDYTIRSEGHCLMK